MIPELEIAYPRQVVLITSKAEVQVLGKKIIKENAMAASWHSPLSFDPPLYGVLVGKERFSYKLIKKSQAFAVNFMPIADQKKVLFCGSRSGEHIDKFREAGIAKKQCEKIDCPYAEEAAAYLECAVQEEIEVGDHVLFVGKILKSQELKKDDKRIFQARGDKFVTTL